MKQFFFIKVKKKKVYEIVKELVDFIDNYIDKNSLLQKLFNDLNFILNVPNIILKKDQNNFYLNHMNLKRKNLTINTLLQTFFLILLSYLVF